MGGFQVMGGDENEICQDFFVGVSICPYITSSYTSF